MTSSSSFENSAAHVLIALGSNIFPEENLPAAVELLASHQGIEVVKASSVWESEPVGFHDQANFCNAAVSVSTSLSPHQLKQELLKFEDQLLRVRDPSNKNGPRTIDLDISVFGEEVVDLEGLKIPDPEIQSRPFLAIPLAEVAADQKVPVIDASLEEIARPFLEKNNLRKRLDIDLLTAGNQNID